jgi:hypothetical protein
MPCAGHIKLFAEVSELSTLAAPLLVIICKRAFSDCILHGLMEVGVS